MQGGVYGQPPVPLHPSAYYVPYSASGYPMASPYAAAPQPYVYAAAPAPAAAAPAPPLSQPQQPQPPPPPPYTAATL
jgi:hypothetical protein